MIHILSWTTKNYQKALARPLHSKLKKIQGLSKDLHRNLRTFQGLFETARTLSKIGLYFTQRNGPIFRVKTDFSALQWFFQLCTDQAKAVGELTQQVREMTSEVGGHNPGR